VLFCCPLRDISPVHVLQAFESPEAAAAACVKDIVGAGVTGNAHVALFGRRGFTITAARELLSLFGVLASTAQGREVLQVGTEEVIARSFAGVHVDMARCPAYFTSFLQLTRSAADLLFFGLNPHDVSTSSSAWSQAAALEGGASLAEIASEISRRRAAPAEGTRIAAVDVPSTSNSTASPARPLLPPAISHVSTPPFGAAPAPLGNDSTSASNTSLQPPRPGMYLAQAPDDVLCTLVNLGSARSPGTAHLARHLLSCVDYSTTRCGGRLLLTLWALSSACNAYTDDLDPVPALSGPRAPPNHPLQQQPQPPLHQQPVSLLAAALKQHSQQLHPPPSPAAPPSPWSVGAGGTESGSGGGGSGASHSMPPPLSLPGARLAADEARVPVPTVFASSPALALYATAFLRVLLRRGDPGFSTWGINLLMRQLRASSFTQGTADASARALGLAALSILYEAAMRSRIFLLSFIAAQPVVSHLPLRAWAPIVTLAVAEPTGLAWARSQGLVAPLMSFWLAAEHVRYAAIVEGGFMQCLSSAEGSHSHIQALPEASVFSAGNFDNGASPKPVVASVPLWMQRHAETASAAANAVALSAGGGGSGWPRPPPAMLATPPMLPAAQFDALATVSTSAAGRALAAELARADRTARALLPHVRSLQPAGPSINATVSMLALAASWDCSATYAAPVCRGLGDAVVLSASSQAYGRFCSSSALKYSENEPIAASLVTDGASKSSVGDVSSALHVKQLPRHHHSIGSFASKPPLVFPPPASTRSQRGMSLPANGALQLKPSTSSVSVDSLVGPDAQSSVLPSVQSGRSHDSRHFNFSPDDISANLNIASFRRHALARPWPLPLVIPKAKPAHASPSGASAAASAAGRVQEPRADAWDNADSAFCADLDALVRLPWRIDVWAEWDRLSAGNSGSIPAFEPPSSGDAVSSGSQSFASGNAAPAGAAAGGGRRDVIRMDIPCDTFVDLASVELEQRWDGWDDASPGGHGEGPPLPCDGFISAVCVDGTGAVKPFQVPSHAVIKAALFCGATAVSQLGEIPAAPFASVGSSAEKGPLQQQQQGQGRAAQARPPPVWEGPGAVAAFDSVDTALLRLAASTGWEEQLAAADGLPESTAAARRQAAGGGATARSGLRREASGRRKAGGSAPRLGANTRGESGGETSDGLATSDDGGGGAGGGGRGSASTRGRVVTGGGRKPGSLTETTAAALLLAQPPLLSGGVRSDHSHLEDAAARLRRRSAAAVSSLRIAPQRRHVHAWVADAGLACLVEPLSAQGSGGAGSGGGGAGTGGSTGASRQRSGSADDLSQGLVSSSAASAGASSTALPSGSTRLPDFVAGGPEANTIANTSAPAALVSAAQAAALLRPSRGPTATPAHTAGGGGGGAGGLPAGAAAAAPSAVRQQQQPLALQRQFWPASCDLSVGPADAPPPVDPLRSTVPPVATPSPSPVSQASPASGGGGGGGMGERLPPPPPSRALGHSLPPPQAHSQQQQQPGDAHHGTGSRFARCTPGSPMRFRFVTVVQRAAPPALKAAAAAAAPVEYICLEGVDVG
jgi:hypothetical protein